MAETPEVRVEGKQNRGFILGSMSFAHGFSHMYDFGLAALMPTISSALALSNLQVATLLGLRQLGAGAMNLGGGPFVDVMKRHWGHIFTGCMLWSAASVAILGASPNFILRAVGIVLFSLPGTLWHLPAAAALSQRFPDRRGFAISTHTFGANVGNVIGPQLAKYLLHLVTWRAVLFIWVAPALLMAVFVWWSLGQVGRDGEWGLRRQLWPQILGALKLIKDPAVRALVVAATLRAVALTSLFNWTPFYLEETLELGHIRTGFYLSLLAGLGIASVPVLGAMSDRFGRKQVLVPSLATAALLSMTVVSVGDSMLLPLVLAGLGVFSFALHSIIQAATLDIVGRGTEATTIGLTFGLSGIFGGVSPFLAAVIIDHLGGFGSIFYYSGALTAATAVIIVVAPLRRGLQE